MRQVSLSDFSGGISENLPFDAFAPDSVARAKGFILDGTTSIRTQWAVEELTGHECAAIYGFDSRDVSFLVCLKADGTLHYCVAPDDDAAVGSVSWQGLTTGVDAATGASVALVADPNYRFVCELPDDGASYEFVSTTSADGGTPAVSAASTGEQTVLYSGNSLLINACYEEAGYVRPSQAIVLRPSGSTLSAIVYSAEENRYPQMELHASIPDLAVPKSNVMPHANVGVMWGDSLFLADVFWYGEGTEESSNVDVTVDDAGTPDDAADDTTTTTVTYNFATMYPSLRASNPDEYAEARRYKNAIWVSRPGEVDRFDNLSLELPASDDAQIVAMEVVDAGLLVYTTNAASEAGLILLRGTSGSHVVEKLRNISAPRSVDETYRPAMTLWQASGSVVVVDRLGGVWASNGDTLARLDGPASVDFRFGADPDDHCVALGQYLFAAHSGRLLCMRAFGATAGWTELLTPFDGVQVKSMTSAGNSLYFLQSNRLFRFSCGRNEGYGSMPAAADSDVFEFGSQTIAIPSKDGDMFARSQWHRAGLVLAGDGVLVDVSVSDAPVLSSGNVETVVLSEAVVERSQHVVPARVGFVSEGSVSFRVTGDVSVESLTLWYSPGKRGW